MAKRVTNLQIAAACGTDRFMVARVVAGSADLGRRHRASRNIARWIARALERPVELVFPEWQ